MIIPFYYIKNIILTLNFAFLLKYKYTTFYIDMLARNINQGHK